MDSTFGARLRAQRERQQVALTAIAEQTKIRLPLLEELEKDDISRWPTGIFRRSYIRHYARAVGLEPDAVVREFLELYPDAVDNTPEAVAAARGLNVEASRQSPPTRLKFLLDSAIDALPALRSEPIARTNPAPEIAPPAAASPPPVAPTR
jgi:cytoskeletal protein RodZ